jgi:hypothetical protein
MALLAGVVLTLSSETFAATISNTPYKINGGKADFGSGFHFNGSPSDDAHVKWELSVVNGVTTAKATVTGTLYYDNSSGSGTARLRIEAFKFVAPAQLFGLVETRIVNVTGPGGDANLAANQAAINESFSGRDLIDVRVSTFEVSSTGRLTNGRVIEDSTSQFWTLGPQFSSGNGNADFGSGNHSFGSPSFPGFVNFFRSLPGSQTSQGESVPLGNMLGTVNGTLYWDALFDHGTARIVIDFQDANGNNLSSRTRDVTGPGGNANSADNQRPINENFIDPAIFQVRLRVGTVSNGVFGSVTSKTFAISSGTAGTFDLSPSTADVTAKERVNYNFRWTVPGTEVWRDLQTLRFRIRDSENVILSLLFDVASETFALVDEDSGRIGPAFQAGSNAHLETRDATLYLADTSVIGSGPTGPSVTLILSLDLKPRTRGGSFRVEVAAADKTGNQDTFAAAGSLIVAP